MSCALPTPDTKTVRPTGAIYIAGDSTAADYPDARAPQIGWGQTLRYFVMAPEKVHNRAVNGRSTRSFTDEGKWVSLLQELAPGDLVLISFGHNDSRDDDPNRFADAETDYRANLELFVKDVADRGAIPVILSSPARRLWEGAAMVETHGLYRKSAETASASAGANFIDLSILSLTYFEGIGREETKRDFLWLSPDPAHVRFPDGVEDNTHFTELGACGLARIIAAELHETEGFHKMFAADRLSADVSEGHLRPDSVRACAESVAQSRK